MERLLKIKDEYLMLSKGVIDYEKFNHYSIVHHGSSIEGSSLTLLETFLLLDENLTPKNKPLQHSLMAVDHLTALNHVIALATKKAKLSVDIVKEVSAHVMKNTGSEISAMAGNFDSSKGEFRKATVRAGNRTFMDYQKVPERVQELVDQINNTIGGSKDFIKNSQLAFDAHFQMVSIHPFADGNGRLSRLMMNYVQKFHDQPMTIVFQEDKKDYLTALEDTREKEDITIFHSFMFNQSYKFFQHEINSLKREQKEDRSQEKGRGLSLLF